jgi:dolichol-phosphate mannosyltransferase
VSTDDLTVGLRTRVRHGVRHPANWLQLFRFALVGGSGYVVNLAVFTVLVQIAAAGHIAAAVGAWLVAVANNFFWNRRWTFRARAGHAGSQAARFITVSVAALVFNLVVLELLVVSAELPEVPAQAIAIVAAMPLSFLGNKLWTFDW